MASVPLASSTPSHTSYLEIPIGNLMVPTNISYDDILERHGGSGGIPDPSHLTTMVKDLKQLCDLAAARNETCNAGMRALAEKRKDVLEEEREREREQASRAREAEERESSKREAQDEDGEEEEENLRGRKGGKIKKKKETISAKEDRPLNHGAHGLARQDGLDLPLKGMFDPTHRSYIIKKSSRMSLGIVYFILDLLLHTYSYMEVFNKGLSHFSATKIRGPVDPGKIRL